MKLNFIKRKYTWILFLLLIYILIRIFTWKNFSVLEGGQDSVTYLITSKIFLNFDLIELKKLDADTTYFYSFFAALFSVPGWSIETGARLCSLIFSIGLFIFLLKFGEKITSARATIIALIFLSFNVHLIISSVSILQDISYIALVYLGIWLLWIQKSNQSLIKSFNIGLVFGSAFLNRTEGIIFLAFVPFILIIQYIFFSKKGNKVNLLLKPISLFVLGFLLLSIPQVWTVSNKMGTFALNGREIWIALSKLADGRPYEEKIYGLDYHPGINNLQYLQKHPEEYNKLRSELSLFKFYMIKPDQLKILFTSRAEEMFGLLGLVFIGFGFLYLYLKKNYYLLFFIISFVTFCLIPPLISDARVRHLAGIIPIGLLVAGIGVEFLSNLFLKVIKKHSLHKFFMNKFSYIIVLVSLILSAGSVYSAVNNPISDIKYSPKDFKVPLSIINKDIKESGIKGPKITSRKGFFPYAANIRRIALPFTNYDGLIKYCKLNGIDYLFLSYNEIKNFPFLNRFREKDAIAFKLLYSATSEVSELIELYKTNF